MFVARQAWRWKLPTTSLAEVAVHGCMPRYRGHVPPCTMAPRSDSSGGLWFLQPTWLRRLLVITVSHTLVDTDLQALVSGSETSVMGTNTRTRMPAKRRLASKIGLFPNGSTRSERNGAAGHQALKFLQRALPTHSCSPALGRWSCRLAMGSV